MDNELKWMCIIVAIVFIPVSIGMMFEIYSKALENKAAMENGYEQQVDDYGRKLWKKIDVSD